ncbi:flagellar basal body rod protein FlgC [Pleionea sediminis]|uniref:flagellar basal body rod protein FlgC n=1 Tax=Pleionea sediminis TaxID=2569479 RepID=UPI001185EB4D|nr:flagellar basal body rod C-terminal domain-containing protein [Pleionea sediminis]
MAESISEIAKLGMNYQMLVSEMASKKIAMANVPVSPEVANSSEFKALLGASESNTDSMKTKQVHEPDNPMADDKGMVTYLDIDVASEFVKMTLAKRAYEANIRIYNNASNMKSKALEIGK